MNIKALVGMAAALFGSLAFADGATGAAEKPMLIAADDFGAYFKDAKNEMTKAGLEAYADGLVAGGQVTHVFWCPVAGRANFDAKETDPIWKGLENPATAFLRKNEAKANEAANRLWAENAKKLNDAGIDPYKVWIDRTRAKGVSPWISIRLTDTQYSSDPAYFRTPSVLAQHQDWLLKNGGHGGGAADYARGELRDWFKKVVAETVARYKDVDGVEIDCISGNNYWTFLPHDMPNGRPKREAFNAFVTELRQIARAATGKKDLPIALRIVNDTNLFVPNFMDQDLPADILIPNFDKSPKLLRDWVRFSRTSSARVVPAVLGSVQLPQLAASLSRIRGCGFTGTMLKSLDKAPADVRKTLAAGELHGTKGPREFVFGEETHMIEWKRLAWGYKDCRKQLPWKLDKAFGGEFAVEKGSVVEKGAKVELNVTGKGPRPKTVLLNGWQPTEMSEKGTVMSFSFPKESVIDGFNQITVPAVEPGADPKATVSIAGISVKVDL